MHLLVFVLWIYLFLLTTGVPLKFSMFCSASDLWLLKLKPLVDNVEALVLCCEV